MKYILFILLFVSSILNAQWVLGGSSSATSASKTYYVSNSGSDANDGLTTSTPWKTIGKVNSVPLDSGTTIKFELGGNWSDTTIIAQPGIRYSTYGSGYRPVFDLRGELNAWSYFSGSHALDTTSQNLSATGTTTTSAIIGWKLVITTGGTIYSYLFRTTSQTVNTKTSLYDNSLNLVASSTSETRSSQLNRSEERRVGKECRSRWSPYH